MRFRSFFLPFLYVALCVCALPLAAQTPEEKVLEMARALVATGYSAGEGYQEVWIRDLNTFILVALEVRPQEEVRDQLRRFFQFQGEDGNIVDGFVPKAKAGIGYEYIHSPLAPDYLAHKNTVETDQETSLVQAVARYVLATGDRAFLEEEVGEKTVLDRLDWAMEFLLEHRYSEKHGLLWGGTTADWGDVQPEHEWGVVLDESSHRAIDIYDNAMFLIALRDLQALHPEGEARARRRSAAREVRARVREHLWDDERQKFVPHVYLEGSPFPEDFDEAAIHYHGGTAVAILAGLLSQDEIAVVLAQQRENVKAAGASSIGLTLYPAYPEGFFKNPILSTPYTYQNGGDWTWFGARMITALAENGFVDAAKTELQPMIDRAIRNEGFHEWYSLDNEPRGSGLYRGSAGVLAEAIHAIRKAEAMPGSLPEARAELQGDTLWFDALELGLEGQLWTDLEAPYDRLPATAHGTVRDPVWSLSRNSAGIAVRFLTDSPTVRAQWTLRSDRLAMNHMPATGVSGLDLYARDGEGWRWVAVGIPEQQENEKTLLDNKPKGMHEFLLYLPLYNGVRSLKLGIAPGTTLAKGPAREGGQAPVVFYGTSITQGGCAARPGMAYPAILGRWLNVETVNLGFSGNGTMDPEFAELLGGIDAAAYVLSCLPNMKPEQIEERYESFVRRLRELRPETPIVLVGHIIPQRQWFHDSDQPNVPPKYEVVQQALAALQDVPGLYHVAGAALLGEDGEGTVDGVHPTDVGFQRIAEAIRPVLEPLLTP